MTKIQPIQFCEETILKKHELERGYLDFCKRLKDIRDFERFKGRWDSFEDFLHDPEMNMDKSTANRMINIYEVFVGEFKIDPEKIIKAGGWAKVSEILPIVQATDKANAEHWLEVSASLSRDDLRREIKSIHNGQEKCKHKNTFEIVMRVCRDCDHKEVIKTNQ